jgi:hypothetical protein
LRREITEGREAADVIRLGKQPHRRDIRVHQGM